MQIQSLEQLGALYNAPSERVIRKEQSALDHHIEAFIALSPFLMMASGNEALQMDASPRGGEAGFVKVLDRHTLLIPDAPGNNRLDTLQNIVSTGRLGLLFLIPGVDEMLRINGQASLHTDATLLNIFSSLRNPPKLVIRVHVESSYMHCAKAVMRARLWSAQSKVDRSVLPSMGEILKDHAQLPGPAESRLEMLQRYAKDL